MSVNEFSFRGLMAPVFTPFDGSGNIDFNAIVTYSNYLRRNEIKGILVNGTTGEGTSMTREERSQVLGKWIEMKKNVNFNKSWDVTIMVQVGGTNLSDVKYLAKDAEHKRADAILCLPDLFFKPSKLEDLISYLKIVSLAAPRTPLLYYHIPSYTGVNLNMKELLEASYQIPNFVGIKYTAQDLEMVSSCVLTGAAVFLGCDEKFLSALSKGFDSAISTSINLFPNLHNNILTYYKNGELKEAQLEQEKLNRNISQITKYGPWVSSMKGAMRAKTRIEVGFVRPPLTDVNFEVAKLKFE